MNSTDQDCRIRSALQKADNAGKLDVVAAVTGVPGGETRLREILGGKALSIVERGMLSIHLED